MREERDMRGGRGMHERGEGDERGRGMHERAEGDERGEGLMAIINTLRFLLSVCLCVTDVGVAVTNLRVVCKIIACRVQNYRVRSSCHRNFLEM